MPHSRSYRTDPCGTPNVNSRPELYISIPKLYASNFVIKRLSDIQSKVLEISIRSIPTISLLPRRIRQYSTSLKSVLRALALSQNAQRKFEDVELIKVIICSDNTQALKNEDRPGVLPGEVFHFLIRRCAEVGV